MWEIHTYLPDEYICIIEKHLIQVFSLKHFPRQHAPKYFLRDRLLFQSLQSRLLEFTFSEHCFTIPFKSPSGFNLVRSGVRGWSTYFGSKLFQPEVNRTCVFSDYCAFPHCEITLMIDFSDFETHVVHGKPSSFPSHAFSTLRFLNPGGLFL